MNYLLETFILEIKEVYMKTLVLKDLIDRLYDGIGKEVMEEYLGIISRKLGYLIDESKEIKEKILKLTDKELKNK